MSQSPPNDIVSTDELNFMTEINNGINDAVAAALKKMMDRCETGKAPDFRAERLSAFVYAGIAYACNRAMLKMLDSLDDTKNKRDPEVLLVDGWRNFAKGLPPKEQAIITRHTGANVGEQPEWADALKGVFAKAETPLTP